MLLIVNYHAAIGGQDPPYLPLHTPLLADTAGCRDDRYTEANHRAWTLEEVYGIVEFNVPLDTV